MMKKGVVKENILLADKYLPTQKVKIKELIIKYKKTRKFDQMTIALQEQHL